MSPSRYQQRGVSAQKEDVHKAIKKLDKGLFPKAFCKILPDVLTQHPEYCLVMHADGAINTDFSQGLGTSLPAGNMNNKVNFRLGKR